MSNELKQGTQEWLEWRRNRIGASDAPIIMGESPWKTPYQLWQEKVGVIEPPPMNAAMRRGHEMEPLARAAFEMTIGEDVYPQVKAHPDYPWMIASMDGLSLCGKIAVEIKCPGHQTHMKAVEGSVPEHYMAQLQHQLAVCDLEYIYYYSFDGENGVMLKVERDDDYIKSLIEKEKAFYQHVQDLTEPELSDRDFVEQGQDWVDIAEEARHAMEMEKLWKDRAKEAKERLQNISDGHFCKGGAYRFSFYHRKGSVQYNKIPELEGVDVEKYRKSPSIVWRLTETQK